MFVSPFTNVSADLVCMFVLCTAAMIHVNWKLALLYSYPCHFSLLIYMLNNRINKGSESYRPSSLISLPMLRSPTPVYASYRHMCRSGPCWASSGGRAMSISDSL
jgi:hypothetical protein